MGIKLMDNKELFVLIVEDEIFAAKYLEGLLRSLDFEHIFKATNAQSALEIVQQQTIHLAFMDINIAGATDGIECSKILNKEYFLPIIFTTAYGDSQTLQEANDTNFYGYLVKPFEKHDLEASLRVALKMLQREQSARSQTHQDADLIDLGHMQQFNKATKTLFVNTLPLNLTNKETQLLSFFCSNMNQNVAYDTLKQEVWVNDEISNSTIRDTIARLKKKVPKLNLENIISYGYVLKR